MKVRVLYLTYDGLTDPLGRAQILPYLKGLSAVGYFITVISCDKPEAYAARQAAVLSECLAAGIEWISLPYHKRPPVLSTLLDLYRMYRKAGELHKIKSFDLIHCRSYLPAILGKAFKRRWKVPFLFDMRGFWADERVEGGIWNLRNPLYKLIYNFLKREEKILIREAAEIVVLTNAAAAIVEAWDPNKKVNTIPCCVDLDHFRIPSREVRDTLRLKWGIPPTDFVLLYLGSLGTWYQVQEMLAYYQRLSQIKPAWFLVVTPDLHLVPKGDRIIGVHADRNEVPGFIGISDASICFIRPTFSKLGSSATKMAEVMAMQVPVLVNAGWGDVTWIDSTMGGILIVDPEKPEQIDSSVSGTVNFNLSAFTAWYSLESGVSRYDTIYRRLVQTSDQAKIPS